jgi:endonuclease-3 related protein
MNKGLNRKLMDVYKLMFEHFGPRNWWPAETSLEMIAGALLTQFVSWKNVEVAIKNLKDEGLLNILALCEADSAYLEELVKPARFYRQKAKKLKEFSSHVKINYAGNLQKLLGKDMHELRKELLSLYGIGEETADSILLYAAEKPIFVVDAYTRRIFSRLGFFKEDASYGKMQEFFMDNLEHDVKLFNEYHALIVGVGNNYCSNKKPKCAICPLAGTCKSIIN